MLFYHKIIPNIICQPVLSFAGNILLNKIISKHITLKVQENLRVIHLKSIHFTLEVINIRILLNIIFNFIRGNDVNDIVAVGGIR